ncbi:methyl-CpG-binding domain-containing protein 9 isoform X1 [Nymphaea colorata]|nr:methyl-CpG-binding domain-containing protein 9 isoform X1 [Nymphaea colorata]
MEGKDEIRPRTGGVFLCIDLNEMPETVPPDAYNVVKRLHENVAPATGAPAEHPGETGVGEVLACGLCGRPETRGSTLVCDGCERGFHLSCLRMRHRRAVELEDWLCGECEEAGDGILRWGLGAVSASGERRKSGGGVRLLDINALPPNDSESDAEGGGGEDTATSNSRSQMSNDDFFSRWSSKMDCMSNGYDLSNRKISTAADFSKRRSFTDERTSNEARTDRNSLDNVVSGITAKAKPKRRGRPRSASRLQQDVLLEALEDYVSKNHGVLGEGWRIELKQRGANSEAGAVYCAPEGKVLYSMSEVAMYLGLKPAKDFGNGFASGQKRLPSFNRKRWESMRLKCAGLDSVTTDTCMDGPDITRSGSEEICSDIEMEEPNVCRPKYEGNAIEATAQLNNSCPSKPNINLPIQYEDFFIHHLGKIDCRPLYHNTNQIWPVGYESSWHDRITGSFFTCTITDGGEFGPMFKVRRCPCTVTSMPDADTVISNINDEKIDNDQKLGFEKSYCELGFDEDESIQMHLHDPCELCSPSCYTLQGPGNNCQPDGSLSSEYMEQLQQHSCYMDEIGEFFVEGRSSSSVWSMVSQTLIDACIEIFKQSGVLQFCCNHNLGDTRELSSPLPELFNAGAGESVQNLRKFCSSTGPKHIPQVIKSESDLETSCEELRKWLNQDRFGLDVEFVQELLEQSSGVQSCSDYVLLAERCSPAASKTVGSGFFLAKRKAEVHCETESTSDELCRSLKRSRNLDSVVENETKGKAPPPGRPLSTKLPLELVGDVLQMWEFLGRFHEVLGMKEPLSFEELEEELIEPWPNEPSALEKLEKEIQEYRELAEKNKTGNLSSHFLSPENESDLAISKENQHAFIQVETLSVNEAAQGRVASRTYGRCTGVALAKAHTALLKLLVGELQYKVTAILDPNADAGEQRPKRGRKRDSEVLQPLRKPKPDVLPINELTWPELSRRYVLAILAMDGTHETGEITSRDSAKILRCLRGDGGVLTGALAGLSGMEADALLLAEAEKQVSDPANEDIIAPVDCKDIEMDSACERVANVSGDLPEWAQVLEPVRKLPTNVGTRIRKCVYDALEKNPPDWAREILLHSISKEVYKGNASGPTKKAVLSLLADVCGEGTHRKPDKARKQRSGHSCAEIIMKQCRAVLRNSLAADEGKVFCNLLGSTLVSTNDNEDEGILGAPAMVSRPLDFRTIDLRLAVGAYGGMHEAFLEDVREVWSNISTAYGDRPELLQLAESLSQNFESLYVKEVLGLIQKLKGNAGPDGISSEAQKDLQDVLAYGNEIPKAPWEEGVCKVCGIDKDDESVLLCDTCDSEYHTYCLSPPLARIPEGNWYCPSCISGQSGSQFQAAKEHTTRKKSKGVDTRAFSDALDQLVSVMEENEYWELGIKERAFLLKFLCDEALNSAVIREHLEQCQDSSVELQSKLRLQSIEWRNLCLREEFSLKMAKETVNKSYGVTEDLRGQGQAGSFMCEMMGQHQLLTNGSDQRMTFSGYLQNNSLNKLSIPFPGSASNGLNKHVGYLLPRSMEANHLGGFADQSTKMPTDVPVSDSESTFKSKDIMHSMFPFLLSGKIDKENPKNSRLPALGGNHQNEELNRVSIVEHGDAFQNVSNVVNCLQNSAEKIHDLNSEKSELMPLSAVKQMDQSEKVRPSFPEEVSANSVACAPNRYSVDSTKKFSQDNLLNGHVNNICLGTTEPEPHEACSLVADPLRQQILQLQETIANTETQLLKVCMRREFLGRDSIGRLYWAFSRPNNYPWLVVDGSMQVKRDQRKPCEATDALLKPSSDLPSSSSVPSSGRSQQETFTELSPARGFLSVNSSVFECVQNAVILGSPFPWVIYETASEIHELMDWLKCSHSQEVDLGEWDLQLQRVRPLPVSTSVSDDPQADETLPLKGGEKTLSFQFLNTHATALLEKKYGPCLEPDAGDALKRRGRKTKISHEERMFRCECLEPVWPSRYHCISCHHTFCNSVELEEHNDGKCNSVTEENKENDEISKGRGMKSECSRHTEHIEDADLLETSKNGRIGLSLKYSKFRKKSAPCPYDIEEIINKFFTKDSNKEIVREIGLLGSGGVPTFVPVPSFSSTFDSSLQRFHEDTHETDEMSRLVTHEEQVSISAAEVNDGNQALTGVLSLNDMGTDVNESMGDGGALKFERCISTTLDNKAEAFGLSNDRISDAGPSHKCVIPEISLRPLFGRSSQILKRLKMNLLDMDAALTDEAMRPSRSSLSKRRAWRSLVKSAESIFEMVQATIIFENMIKTEFMRNGWWYWSSFSAAIKISTVSSLALRVYALDAAIVYQKAGPGSDPQENSKIVKPGRKRKDSDA